VKPLDFFGYFKSTKFDHSYTRFERNGLGEESDSSQGPKYKLSNEEVIKRNSKLSLSQKQS
jgi:hypothetical protein